MPGRRGIWARIAADGSTAGQQAQMPPDCLAPRPELVSRDLADGLVRRRGLALAVAAVYGLVLALLQLIERGTGGWGLKLHFFRVQYLLAGPWYLSWLPSFVGLALVLVWGMWFGIVYRRWNLIGLLSFLAVQLLAVAAILLVIGGANAWRSASRFFTMLTIEGLTGLLAALTMALLAGGYATVRRLTV